MSQRMLHVFYIPSSYGALLYALLAGTALLSCLYIALILHSKTILATACGEDHYEFWPTISATIGDMMPERQTWRLAFVLCVPFRVSSTISLFNVFWQKSSRGMADLYNLRLSWKLFFTSTAFLTLLMLWVDLWRLIAAVMWTLVSSRESLMYHNLGFCPYLFFCFVLQLTLTTLVRRNQRNQDIYVTPDDAAISYRLKRASMWGESICVVGVICCYTYHFKTCANGWLSFASMFEWGFAMCNIFFDGSAWFDLKREGWWLSASPSFYRARWAHKAHTESSKKSVSSFPRAVRSGAEDKNGASDSDIAIVIASPNNNEHSLSHRGGGSPDTNEQEQLTSPLLVTTGELFLGNDVVLHRFSFCSAPSRLLLWICDVYWAHLFFEMILHLIQHMYYMPLVAMSLSWEVCSVFVIGAPCLLRIPSFRRWATGPCYFAGTWLKPAHVPTALSHRVVPMYILFYTLASLSHLHQLIRGSPRNKILVVSLGSLFLSLAHFTRFLYPPAVSLKQAPRDGNEDSRRMIMTLPLGLVLCMLLRVLHVGASPFFIDPFFGVIYGIVLGLFFTTIIYRHVMMGNALKEACQQSPGLSAAAMSWSPHKGGFGGRCDMSFSLRSNPNERPPSGSGLTQLSGSLCSGGLEFSGSQIDELSENTVSAVATLYPAPSPALLGILFGSISSIGITFFSCANYIPRLLAVKPFPANLVIAGIFAAGLYFSSDVLPLTLLLLRPRGRPDVVRRVLHSVFGGCWTRFGALLAMSTMLMLYATRETDFVVEMPHEGYPLRMDSPENMASLAHWKTQEMPWRCKPLAFVGGLGFTFCIGVLFPFVMEVTWVHQRERRLVQTFQGPETNGATSRECFFFTSFEFAFLISTLAASVLHALCISYPFVPMGWLVREKSRPLIITQVALLYITARMVAGRIRGSSAVTTAVADVQLARKQRSIQLMVVMLVAFSFVWVFIGRVTLGSTDISFPEGKKTAVQHQNEVLHLHKMLVELRRERNRGTDTYLRPFEATYYQQRFEDAMERMGKNITESKGRVPLDPTYNLGHLSLRDRIDVWDAARAMTFFSGAIWTIHFGLDNFNVDSLARLVEKLRETEAGVIGLLESDTMHLTNGNRDLVEYIAYHLGFRYTDYGPTALDNTYGCALITRYPILSIRRYVTPSPLGELGCLIHAVLDVYGVPVHTYVSHFGNTEHWADVLLQSQFLGELVLSNPGPTMCLAYLVTHPGMKGKYQEYADPSTPGKLRDAALQIYRHHPWERLRERGGYEGQLPVNPKNSEVKEEFNITTKFAHAAYLEEGLQVDSDFQTPPVGQPQRHFFYNSTGRYGTVHPRLEFLDRYCQYSLYKTGATADEAARDADKLQPYQIRLFDWWRIIDRGVELLSDTEIQVIQLSFEKRI